MQATSNRARAGSLTPMLTTAGSTPEPGRMTLRIRGVTPTVMSGQGMRKWRAAAARQARSIQRPADIAASSEFRVDAVFYTVLPHRRSGDLDNLAKPVLDTLFRGSHVQETDDSLAGALFDADDGQVVDLRLRKVNVGSHRKEGVDLTIEWKSD
jgi:Holliday junction resolvase RusA-like endonuclease